MNAAFDEKFSDFLDTELSNEEADSYLELDKSAELAYMRSQEYRFKRVFSAIPVSQKSLKILDCGTTPFTFLIKRIYPHYDIATMDRTNLMEERCTKRGIEFGICDLPTQAIPFADNHFDIVIFTEVLEHLIAAPERILNEIHRVLRGGGLLILSTPNFANLFNRTKLLFGINPLQPAHEQMKQGWVHGYGHIREYTMKECLHYLKSSGFEISARRFISPLPHWPSNSLSSVVTECYHILCLAVPSFRAVIHIEAAAIKSNSPNVRPNSIRA